MSEEIIVLPADCVLKGIVSTGPVADHFIGIDGEFRRCGEIEHPRKVQSASRLGMDLVKNFCETAAGFYLQLFVTDADLWFESEGRNSFVFQTTG